MHVGTSRRRGLAGQARGLAGLWQQLWGAAPGHDCDVFNSIYKYSRTHASPRVRRRATYAMAETEPGRITNHRVRLEISDFRYVNAESVLENSNITVNLIDSHTLIVDQSVIGSSISRTFKNSVSESFTWGFEEKISVGTEFKVTAGIPLLAAAETKVNASFEVGATQQWTKNREQEVSVTATLVPTKPGTYRMEGLVQFTNNVELKFIAKSVATATKLLAVRLDGHDEMGWEDTGIPVAAAFLLYDLREQGFNIISSQDYSVEMLFRGTLKGSYGLNTLTSIHQVA